MKIFVGSSTKAKVKVENISAILKDVKDCEVIPWYDAGVFINGDYTLDSLLEISDKVDLAIFIWNEDDITIREKQNSSDEITKNTVRDNVLFEYGIFCKALGRNNVAICRYGSTEIASDLYGLNVIPMKDDNLGAIRLKNWIAGVKNYKYQALDMSLKNWDNDKTRYVLQTGFDRLLGGGGDNTFVRLYNHYLNKLETWSSNKTYLAFSFRTITLSFLDLDKPDLATVECVYRMKFVNVAKDRPYFTFSTVCDKDQAVGMSVLDFRVNNVDLTEKMAKLGHDIVENRGQYEYRVYSEYYPQEEGDVLVDITIQYKTNVLKFFQSHILHYPCLTFNTVINIKSDKYKVVAATFSMLSSNYGDNFKSGEMKHGQQCIITLPENSPPGSGYVATVVLNDEEKGNKTDKEVKG